MRISDWSSDVCSSDLLLAAQVGQYYRDLADTRAVSALAMVHQRFSTNTFPAWPLAHPYRMIAHNGEINTVKGNFNWLRAREGERSEERSVGTECVSTCRFRWSTYHKKKKVQTQTKYNQNTRN